MTNNLTEVIVKVGNTSQLSFSKTKAYRAITSEELEKVASFASECHIVIIEYLEENELDTTRDFIQSFLSKDEKNRVWFYVPDTNDMVTTGLADELDLEICLNNRELFTKIYEATGFILSTNLEVRRELSESDSSESPFDVDLSADNGFSTLEPEEIKHESTVETTESSIDDVNASVEETKEDVKLTLEKSDINESNITTEQVEEIEEHTEIKENTSSITLEKHNEIAEIKVEESVEQSESSDETSEEIDIDLSGLESIEENTHEDLVKSLKEAKDKNTTLLATLSSANTRIEELYKLNKALREQKDAVLEQYNKLVDSDEVIEDPISLKQYVELEETIKKNNETIEHLQKLVDKLEGQLKEAEETIASLNSEIEQKVEKLHKRKAEIEALNERINSGEIQAEALEISNAEIKKLKLEIEELTVQIKMLTQESDGLRNTIDENHTIIEAESIGRRTTLEFSNATIRQLVKVSAELVALKEENHKHLEVIKNLQSSDLGNNEIISSQTAEIISLRKQLQDVNDRIEEAVADVKFEKAELAKQVASLQETVNEQNEQLQMKETLLSLSGVDENGSSTLLENNKMLEDINKTLREQLRMAQSEVEKASKERALAKQSIDKLKDTNAQLTRTLKSVTSTTFGGGTLSNTGVPPINYQGSGFIIPVIGSGSYGITTTAMSIAQQLGQNSKVIYVDFDLVAPKADSWFKISPMCRNLPGFVAGDAKNSGLGIFFERGMDFLMQNINYIVFDTAKDNVARKNGLLHYLSGSYTRLDAVKLLSADFSRLLTYLGNNYNYVIIDMGRLGSSEVNDKIIKAITDVAYKTVTVTTPDTIEIRNFRVKLSETHIKMENMAWLVNMEGNVTLDNRSHSLISPASFGKMPFFDDLYGTKETFQGCGRQARDKFMVFMNSKLFGSN